MYTLKAFSKLQSPTQMQDDLPALGEWLAQPWRKHQTSKPAREQKTNVIQKPHSHPPAAGPSRLHPLWLQGCDRGLSWGGCAA